MIPLTKEEKKSYKNQEACHICQKEFYYDKNDEKLYSQKKG